MKEITVKELVSGDEFIFVGKRKLHKVKIVEVLKYDRGRVPIEFDGKILLVLDNCKQFTCHPDTKCRVHEKPF